MPLVKDRVIQTYEGRAIDKTLKPKVLYPKGSRMEFIFNYDNLDRNKPLYVVEGLMDVPPIWANISKNVTCTFGSNIRLKQLLQLGSFKELVLIPDMDIPGLKMVQKIIRAGFFNAIYLAFLPLGTDPGDVEIDVLKDVINNKVSSKSDLLEDLTEKLKNK